MRCKAGDLAIVVPPSVHDIGACVMCVRLASESEVLRALDQTRFDERDAGVPMWMVDRCVTWSSKDGNKAEIPYCPDDVLLPIQPPYGWLDEPAESELQA